MLPASVIVSYIEHLGLLKTQALDAASEDTFRIRCPYHSDDKPSGTVYIKEGKYVCRAASCGRRKHVKELLADLATIARKKTVTVQQLEAELQKLYGIAPPDDAPMAADAILDAAKTLREIDPKTAIVADFWAKGITPETASKYFIGFKGGRITIPIKNLDGSCFVNVRHYLPNAPGPEKMRNSKGRSKPRLYPSDQLRFDTVVIVGGECKALVSLQQLNAHKIGAIAVTGSEGTWLKEFTSEFSGKTVYVCMDIDEGGRRAANSVARMLYSVAERVYITHLPLDPNKHPKGDPNDFVADGGDMYDAISHHSEEYSPKRDEVLTELDSGEYVARSISSAIAAANVGKRSLVEGNIIGIGEEQYALPSSVRVSCTFDHDACISCAVFGKRKDPRFQVPSEHPSNIAMCGATDKVVNSHLRSLIGIPSKCNVSTLVIENRRSAEIAILSQPVVLAATATNDNRSMQKVLALGGNLSLNVNYRLSSRAQPHPQTQETVLIASELTPTADVLDTKEDADTCLELFRANGDTAEAVLAKLHDIATDLSCNVTRIYRRPTLHIFVDLAYHSPLLLKLEDAVVKGALELLVIGDTGQGKSECVKKLQQHYNLGHVVDCANTSLAGLIGGLQQIQGVWVTTWGAWPANDRKLVILEELKRVQPEVIAGLTETRSSGIAKLAKIRAGQAAARTRCIAVSNPRSDRFLRTYGSSVEAILELIGNPEDVRRFDLCLALSADDLDGDVVHEANRPASQHTYTATACHKLLKWVWTRAAEDVPIKRETKARIFELAQALAGRYSDTIPIIDRGTVRLKLARVAAAIAARLYSTEDGETLDVTPAHVEVAFKLIDEVYSSRAMGYLEWSNAQKATSTLGDKQKKEVLDKLKACPYPNEVAEYLKTRTFINEKELELVASVDAPELRLLLSVLIRNNGIVFRGRNMLITPALRSYIAEIGDIQGENANGF